MANDWPRGIDVASYQGHPDWAAVAADGVTFAIVKATQGTDYVNEMLDPQASCRAAGIYRGFYHFARPDNNSPIDEAAHFLAVIEDRLLAGDVLALDFENYLGSFDQMPSDAESLEEWAWRWLSYTQARAGYKPLFYVNGGDILAHGLNSARLRQYPLWLADWSWPNVPTNLYGWDSLPFWQTGVAPSQAGIIGSCDQDRFLGQVKDIPQFGKPGIVTPNSAPGPANEPTVPDGIFAGLTLAQLREKAEGLVNAVAYLGDNVGDSADAALAAARMAGVNAEHVVAELRRVREESAGPRP